MNVLGTIGVVAAALGVYLFWAILTSAVVRRRGTDVTAMEDRASPRVLFAAGVANLLVLASVLVLIRFLLHTELRSLGWYFDSRDLWFIVVALTVTAGSAVAFLFARRRGEVTTSRDNTVGRTLLGTVVLLVVAAQEEVLFRGYLRLALGTGPSTYLLISTALFVAVHFLTNRISLPQIVSWTLAGLLLGVVYLFSGTLWVAILVHFTIDLTNALVFNIAGSGGVLVTARALSDGERAAYRAIQVVLLAALCFAWYFILFPIV